MDGSGVERALLVQSFPTYGYDNSFAIDAAQEHPDRLRVMVQFDPDGPDLDGAARSLAEHAVVRSARLRILFDHKLVTPEFAPAWDAAASAGLTIEALINGEAIAGRHDDLLAHISRVAPGLVVIHGMHPQRGPDGSTLEHESLWNALSRLPNCSLKINTGSLLAADDDGTGLVDLAHELFGSDRVVFGTNFPATTGYPYGEMVEMGRRSCAHLSPADQQAYLFENGARLWW
jgi:predicted TIM-barrel fold metal-dependent hydrolase